MVLGRTTDRIHWFHISSDRVRRWRVVRPCLQRSRESRQVRRAAEKVASRKEDKSHSSLNRSPAALSQTARNKRSAPAMCLRMHRGEEIRRADQPLQQLFGKYGKRAGDVSSLESWTGLSDSNQHLNCGEVQ